MSLYVTSLNTGSNGNCFYIGNEQEAILVDAGISCREIGKRMNRLGLSMEKIKAIFVSHEHSDHIRGIHSLVKKYHLPVYITPPTAQNGRLYLDNGYIRSFKPHEPVSIGHLTITAFPKFHDASDPYSFTIGCRDVKVGVFTDIGIPCQHVVNYFQQCHAVFLEANYDDDMLENGDYPFHLKKRIRSNYGHLSNHQALDLFKRYRPSFMSHLFLSHLSKNNNCPNLVKELFDRHAEGVTMVVASRYAETDVYHIQSSATSPLIKNEKPGLSLTTSQAQLEFSFA
ncbi:MAG TPA: MBL fold metallo-hydrolase [Flavisolibacter sp.]